jgi:hypothetical protein
MNSWLMFELDLLCQVIDKGLLSRLLTFGQGLPALLEASWDLVGLPLLVIHRKTPKKCD